MTWDGNGNSDGDRLEQGLGKLGKPGYPTDIIYHHCDVAFVST